MDRPWPALTCLVLLDQAVMLGMENGVNSGEADILVHAAVAGDVVRVEKFVVVKPKRMGCPCSDAVGSAKLVVVSASSVAVADGSAAMGNVDQELVTRAKGSGEADRGREVALDEAIVGSADDPSRPLHDDLRHTMRPGMKFPYASVAAEEH